MCAARIAIVDYGMGNLQSVLNAMRHVGAQADLVRDPELLKDYDKILLPGVGAFSQAIAHLKESGMKAALDTVAGQGKEILGICLGMQLMCRDSEEDGLFEGLGWIAASVKRFPGRLNTKIPHIGWNDLQFQRRHYLLEGLPENPDVYFVHSYRVECDDAEDVLATSDYGEPFTAIFAHNNLTGIQFHPEKSQTAGLRILRNFADHDAC